MDKHPILAFLERNRALIFPAAATALIFVILIPLPTAILDALLVFNIMLSTIVLMTVMYLRSPLEFSSFPSLLLALTLLRLVLNTATTRLILANASEGTAAAGQVVQAFGTFVAGNSLAVGVIIFAILMTIQFVVITKGATRIAEVAARFTLDGMPGKQMAIDADLNAGLINEQEARQRRDAITREADFYGAMDGASKFVRGDAIAGLIITAVNVLGGLYVGMFEGGLDLMTALEVYTKLTIGDGLASQIPAFVVSIGAGMLVTRSTGKTNMGEEVMAQVFAKPVAIATAAAFLGVLTLTPLPKPPLLTLGGGCALLAYYISRGERRAVARQAQEKRERQQSKPEPIEKQLSVDALELQIGLGLVRIVDRQRGGDLLDRITSLRKQIALELGVIVPPIRIRDSAEIGPNEYALLLRSEPIARAELHADQLLAIDSGLGGEPLGGIQTTEPAFGLDAWWIPPDLREHAERNNYTVVEPTGALATHLTELVRQHAHELLTRSAVNRLIDNLKERNAPLVEEVIPEVLRPGQVQKVLQNLLRERVPIRDLETILETLGDWAPRTKDLEVLGEYARNALARTICGQYLDPDKQIHCVTFDPAVEDYLQGNIQRHEHGSSLLVPPEQQRVLAQRTRQMIDYASGQSGGAPVAVLCAPPVRGWVRRVIEGALPQTPVLGLNEIVRGVEVRAHGVISLEGSGANV